MLQKNEQIMYNTPVFNVQLHVIEADAYVELVIHKNNA